MKVFLVFGGDHYYPSGGWEDLLGRFDTMEEAMGFARELRCDWVQVVNAESGEIEFSLC